MNTVSLRWLFVAVAMIALVVTAILNANQLLLSASHYLLVLLVGVAAVSVVIRGRKAPFAVGFVVLSAITHWVGPSFDLNYFSKGVAEVSAATALLRVCLVVALGCIGGVVCCHVAADPPQPRLPLTMWLSVIVLFAAATIAAGIVKTERLVAEANAAQAATATMGPYGPPPHAGGVGYGDPFLGGYGGGANPDYAPPTIDRRTLGPGRP